MERVERAVRYTFDVKTHQWDQDEIMCIIEARPFQAGCMRTAHRMWEIEQDGSRSGWVAKFSKTPMSSEAVFEDARLSMISQEYADNFNRQSGVEKKVAFLPSYVLKLVDRGGVLCCAEPCLSGEYLKHNNNDGVVATARAVPQAFSHFTYEASNRKILICDIQGVGDSYTDPQILSVDGKGYGVGNIGTDGILKFMRSHVCNDICVHLRLPPIQEAMLDLERKRGAYKMPQQFYAQYPGQPPPNYAINGLNGHPQAMLPQGAAGRALQPPILNQRLGAGAVPAAPPRAAAKPRAQATMQPGRMPAPPPMAAPELKRSVSDSLAATRQKQLDDDEQLARQLQQELTLGGVGGETEDERLARELQFAYETGAPPPQGQQETEDERLARKLQEEYNKLDSVAAGAPMSGPPAIPAFKPLAGGQMMSYPKRFSM